MNSGTTLKASCVMVTRGRFQLATQAVACFADQTYRPRELVVVTDREADRLALSTWVREQSVPEVRFAHVEGPDRTLGELRNVGLDAAEGEVIVQWDDDDLYHPNRIAVQVSALKDGAVASYLTEQLQYFADRREVYLVDWRLRTELAAAEPVFDCIPGTAVYRRDGDLRYPALRWKDDVVMLEQLAERGAVARVSGHAPLYLYRYHGANTMNEAHWRLITRWAAGRPVLLDARLPIELSMAYYARHVGSRPVRFKDCFHRTVFTLAPEPRPDLGSAPPDLGGPTEPLRLTVAIATWNRAPLLRETLGALAGVAVPEDVDWEVLVCDNASTDDTPAVAAECAGSLPLRVVTEPRRGKSFALQRLLAESRGEWVLFLDDDVLATRGWLAAYAEAIRRHPAAGVLGGPILPWLARRPDGLTALLLDEYAWMHSVVTFADEETVSTADNRFVHGPNLAVRRAAVQPEDVDIRRGMFGRLRISGEDLGLASALMARGWEGWRIPGAVVFHFVPPQRWGWRWWVRREIGEARSKAVEKELPPRGWRFSLFATAFVAREVARGLARPYHRWRWRIRGRMGAAWARLRQRLARSSS